MRNSDEAQSAILKALADGNRIRILRLLAREVLNVQELCAILKLPQPRVSRHLSVLRGVGLVHDQREGSRVYYRLNPLDNDLGFVSGYLKAIAEQDHPDLERLDAALRQRTLASRDFAQAQATHWDELGSELHTPAAAMLAFAEMTSNDRVLADLGTGTGLLLPVLAAFARKVYAVDHAPEMLDGARERCRRQGVTNVEFLAGDVEDLGQILPGPVDGMLLHFVLHQLSRPPHILRDLTRLLRPDGRVVIVDRLKHQDEATRQRFGSLWLGFDPDAIREWLKAAGLRSFVCHELPTGRQSALAPGIFVAAGRR